MAEVEAVTSEPGQLAESHLGGGGQEHQGVITGREPPMWLHITTQGIGFVDEIRPDEAE